MGRPPGSKNKPKAVPTVRKPYVGKVRLLRASLPGLPGLSGLPDSAVIDPDDDDIANRDRFERQQALIIGKQHAKLLSDESYMCWRVKDFDSTSEEHFTHPNSLYYQLYAYNDSVGHNYIIQNCHKHLAWQYWSFECALNKHQSRSPESTPVLSRSYKRNKYAAGGVCLARLCVYCFDGEPVGADGLHAVHVILLGQHSHQAYHPYRPMSKVDRARACEVLHSVGFNSHMAFMQLNTSSDEYNSEDPSIRIRALQQRKERSCVVRKAEIWRINGALRAEKFRLAKEDEVSVRRWVEDRILDQLLLFSPYGEGENGQDENNFALAWISRIGEDLLNPERHPGLANTVLVVDSTYNIVQDTRIKLFTLVLRTETGSGFPVSFFLSNVETEVAITAWLSRIKIRVPGLQPSRFVVDCAQAQLNAIRAVWPASIVELCKWHVLRAWGKKLRATVPPDENDADAVTERVVDSWVRIGMNAIMNADSVAMRDCALLSFRLQCDENAVSIGNGESAYNTTIQRQIEYCRREWLPGGVFPPHMWSMLGRRERGLSLMSNTSMLCKSWHNTLKYTLLQRRRGNRMDAVLGSLVVGAPEYFGAQMNHDNSGLGQETIYEAKSRSAAERSNLILSKDIRWSDARKCQISGYALRLGATAGILYEVLVPLVRNCIPNNGLCSCPTFVNNNQRQYSSSFVPCKHIFAARRDTLEGNNPYFPMEGVEDVEEDSKDTVDLDFQLPVPILPPSTALETHDWLVENDAADPEIVHPTQPESQASLSSLHTSVVPRSFASQVSLYRVRHEELANRVSTIRRDLNLVQTRYPAMEELIALESSLRVIQERTTDLTIELRAPVPRRQTAQQLMSSGSGSGSASGNRAGSRPRSVSSRPPFGVSFR